MASVGMKLSELFDPGANSAPHLEGIEITGLTADSREVEQGYLFAALAGTEADGARFVPQAVARGARAILAAHDAAVPEVEIPVLRDDNPRRLFALAAARYFGSQPETAVAVTGTNGKTSVAAFVRQIWSRLGMRAASLGTIGVVHPDGSWPLQHTTPDPVALHRILRDLSDIDVSHVCVEASSHGLAQARVDGVRLTAGAFTNISRDHLDYHDSFEDYFAQKARLFSELLEPGAGAVIFSDSPEADQVIRIARDHDLNLLTVGRSGDALRLEGLEQSGLGQLMRISFDGAEVEVTLPLVGDFQASNALVAAGLAMATGFEPGQVLPCLQDLEGACGRLELVGRTANGAAVFVDFAHTPDALANALDALRPYASGRLISVFGCGGDRDRGKRPQMGRIAAERADVAYVTDDNPRTEDPAAIRAEIMAATPGGIEVGDRADAIERAIEELKSGDVLLVAGKGHETGQTIGTETIPFSDQGVVRSALGIEHRDD